MRLRIVKKKGEDDTILLTIIGELTVYTVSKLKDILLKELSVFSGMVLNLDGIDEADTAGFQLILFLRREAHASGKSLVINQPSTRIRALFSLYNENI